MPFPLNFLLFPLTVAEWVVTWVVAVEEHMPIEVPQV